MFNIGDVVATKALNGATFSGTVVELDRFGFAVVSFGNVSESRIHISQLTKENI
jgi:ribosomal protein S1